jgi:NADH-quinone oxidoreductase subunit N
MLIGLAACLAAAPGNPEAANGAAALLLYLLVYAVATLGAFAALDCLSGGKGVRNLLGEAAQGQAPSDGQSRKMVPDTFSPRQIDGIEELAGLAWTTGWTRRFLAWALALFFFSLTGIPPLAGFWGKLGVILSALNLRTADANTQGWFIALAVIGVLNAAVSAGYYLRVVGVIFFRTPLSTPPTRQEPGLPLLATALCAVLVLAIGVMPGYWSGAARRASPAALSQLDERRPADLRLSSPSAASEFSTRLSARSTP